MSSVKMVLVTQEFLDRLVEAGVTVTEAETDPLPISEHDAERVGEVMTRGDWWTADLLRLIAKSDVAHRERLRLAFPSHVAAYERWYVGDGS